MRSTINEYIDAVLARPCEWCGMPLLTGNKQRRFCDDDSQYGTKAKPSRLRQRPYARKRLATLLRAVTEMDPIEAVRLQQEADDTYYVNTLGLPAWLTEDYPE